MCHHTPNNLAMSSINNEAPPLTPKTARNTSFIASNSRKDIKHVEVATNDNMHESHNKGSESFIPAGNNIRQALTSAPCPCNTPAANYENLVINNSTPTNKFVGPYKNYDIPRTPMQQVTKTQPIFSANSNITSPIKNTTKHFLISGIVF